MITVGIKNLKNSLSRYMRFVKSGERVLVTEHNHIIAEIIPASPEISDTHHLAEYLQVQSDQGKIERAEKKLTMHTENLPNDIDIEVIKNIYHETREER